MNSVQQSDSSRYGYDARDRLVSITDSNSGEIANFQYDVLGRRTRTGFGGGRTLYRYDGDNVIEEDDGAILTTTLNGFGLDERYSRGVDVEDNGAGTQSMPKTKYAATS